MLFQSGYMGKHRILRVICGTKDKSTNPLICVVYGFDVGGSLVDFVIYHFVELSNMFFSGRS